MNKLFFSLVVMCMIILSSCSFSPEESILASRPSAYPDIYLEDARYLLGLPDSNPITIVASKVEIYEKAETAYLTNATFIQQNEQKTPLFSGSFRTAQVNTKTNDATLEGDVVIKNHQDNFIIYAEELSYLHKEQQISTPLQSRVTIVMKERDILSGYGFLGDFKKATYEFMSLEEGRLHYE